MRHVRTPNRRRPITSNYMMRSRSHAVYRKHRQPAWKSPLGLLGIGSTAIACFLLLFGMPRIYKAIRHKQPQVASATEVHVSKEPVKPMQKDTVALEGYVQNLINKHPQLNIGVSYIDLVHGGTRDLGEQAPYVAASTAKLITASYFLSLIETGEASMNDPIGGLPAGDQLKKLIVESDHGSWIAFNDTLGRTRLEAYARQLGMTGYSSANNTVTPRDIALLLKAIHGGELLNQEHTVYLLSLMQNAGEAQYIRSAVPAPIKVYHKAGYLKDRAHDAAIIDDGSYPFVLVIFTKSPALYDFNEGERIFHEITAQAIKTFTE